MCRQKLHLFDQVNTKVEVILAVKNRHSTTSFAEWHPLRPVNECKPFIRKVYLFFSAYFQIYLNNNYMYMHFTWSVPFYLTSKVIVLFQILSFTDFTDSFGNVYDTTHSYSFFSSSATTCNSSSSSPGLSSSLLVLD